ncbi:MAG: hypothetical protein WDO73_17940 [Ignavibacteriota bacterium]
MGDDYLQGAVDAYGRVFSGDGTVHQGLHVTGRLGAAERARRESLPYDLGADGAFRRPQNSRTRRGSLFPSPTPR